MPTVVASETRLGSSTRTVTATFTGYTPQENDLVMAFINTPEDTAAPAITTPSGWTTLTQAANSTGAHSAIYHLVTTGEAAASTTSFDATNYFNANKNWRTCSCVVRSVNQADLIDGFGTAQGGGTTPHPTAAISGTGLIDGSLVLAAVAAGTTATYTGSPSGWSLVVASTSGSGIGLWARDTPTSAGVGVASVNVTPNVGGVSYTSISAAITAPVTDQGDFFAMF